MASSLTGVDGISTQSTTPASTAAQKPLDKDAFLKLLVAQIQYQDPLQPLQGTEYVSQLSQFSMVEQAIAQSSRLDDVNAQLRGLGNNEATALVGKRVTVRGKVMAFDGLTATTSSVSLTAPAQSVTARIVDASGKTVRTIELGARAAGAATITWDGRTDAGQTAPAGNYQLKIDAKAADGKAVEATQDVSGIVKKVSFDKGYAELLLDSGATAPISDLVAVEQADAPSGAK